MLSQRRKRTKHKQQLLKLNVQISEHHKVLSSGENGGIISNKAERDVLRWQLWNPVNA